MTARRRKHPIVTELRRLRQNLGMTREQFANIVGYSYRTIENYEMCYHATSLLTIADVAEYLGYDIVLWPKGVPYAPPAAEAHPPRTRRTQGAA